MAMSFQTIEALASEYGYDLSRLYCERNGFPGFPPEIDLDEAHSRLALLSERINERNFARVVRAWESWLEEGIDK